MPDDKVWFQRSFPKDDEIKFWEKDIDYKDREGVFNCMRVLCKRAEFDTLNDDHLLCNHLRPEELKELDDLNWSDESDYDVF